MKKYLNCLVIILISIILISCENNLIDGKHHKQSSFIVNSCADSLIIESGYGSAVDMYITIINGDTSIVRNGIIPNYVIGKDTVNVLKDTIIGNWFSVTKRGDIIAGREFIIKWDENNTDSDRILHILIGIDSYDRDIKITQKTKQKYI